MTTNKEYRTPTIQYTNCRDRTPKPKVNVHDETTYADITKDLGPTNFSNIENDPHKSCYIGYNMHKNVINQSRKEVDNENKSSEELFKRMLSGEDVGHLIKSKKEIEDDWLKENNLQ